MNFASDNVYGVHPKILGALAAANDGTAPSYGGDSYTARAEEKLKEVFGCDLRAFLVTSGTAANGLALSALTPGYGFGAHAGYGTAVHREAITRLGPCRAHRHSFAPISLAA